MIAGKRKSFFALYQIFYAQNVRRGKFSKSTQGFVITKKLKSTGPDSREYFDSKFGIEKKRIC